MLYAFITFFSSCLGNVLSILGQRNILFPWRYRMVRWSFQFGFGPFVCHRSRRYIPEPYEPRFLLKYTALIVIFLAFFYLFFASLPFSSHDAVCLANVKEQFCHWAFKECAEVDGTFVPALLWFVQVHFCWISPGLYVQPFTAKITSCRAFFFLWDLFAAEASVKRERPFGTPVLRRSSKIRVKRKTLIHRCLLRWTRWVSILKPTDPWRFVWSPASFVAYP